MRKYPVILVLLCLTMHLVLVFNAGVVQAQSPRGTELVNCLDPQRQIVRRARADQCEGRVVSNAEAARIREQRRAYIAESMEEAKESSVIGKRLAGVGAGFFVDFQGAIITNAHVVKDCSDLAISSPNGTVSRVKLVAAQPNRDLALLKGELQPAAVAEFASNADPAGAGVFIVGYPNQGLPPLIPLLTEGTLRPSANTSGPLPFNAAVRPGNSGGPALNAAGQVVGVVFAAADTSKIYQESGRIVRDQGVAIPNSAVRAFLSAHGVTADFKPASSNRLEPHRLLESAREYVVRVECWN
ncbi:putative periplasmic serine endoprotease DegP-like precursor [Thiorhodovibrio winogradskyi]|uniref:Periplasmic serine endoprotease DegP-like n=1 Tax=Thiorhodovibrio winogradskyi TaxID=77007 RepID=A0ABZ0SB20_9GAMM|nr:serine protease [Thiorhodovibrio winogradskyi]